MTKDESVNAKLSASGNMEAARTIAGLQRELELCSCMASVSIYEQAVVPSPSRPVYMQPYVVVYVSDLIPERKQSKKQ